MLDLIVNKALRPLGFRMVKLERGIKVRGFFKNRTFIVGNYRLCSPSTHPLAKNLKQFKYYSRNLQRLVDIVSNHIDDLEVIDIGANIGDSVAFINSVAIKPMKIYCFEGEKEYIKYFRKNTSLMNNVVLFETFLGESTENKRNVVKNNGTLRIDTTSQGDIQIKTLDEVVVENREIKKVKFLKIDTDGYDFKIIRGGKNFISESKPVLFFEYDREYLDMVNDDGFSTFDMLAKVGYNNAIIYDNYGRLLISLDIVSDITKLKQLDAYIKNKKGAFHYYDICLFHKEDESLYEKVITKEMSLFHN
ncbi:MAG: FkbM family methyltransferase [Bacteroidales bacterium]